MIITRLTLKNFGVYAGTNTFEFQNSKPIVLIGGMNGRGKTTFLESVLLALYGANSFAYHESHYHTYGQYLKSYVNTADQTYESYVELEFQLEASTPERYLIRREWNGSSQRTREKVSVWKDGVFNHFLTENWSLFMENILPSGLSNFFFFDGEKIAELAVDRTNEQMKQSIKALLGITVLDTLENDIARIVSKISKETRGAESTDAFTALQKRRDMAEQQLNASEERLADLQKSQELTQQEYDKVTAEYTAKGGDLVAQRQDLFQERAQLSAQITQSADELSTLAASALPLLLVKDLLEKIRFQAEKEHEANVLDLAVSKMQDISLQYAAHARDDLASIQKFIDFALQSAAAERTDSIYNISDASFYQLTALLESDFETLQDRTQAVFNRRDAYSAKINDIDSYLSVDIDEQALAKLYKKAKQLELKVVDLKVQIEAEKKNQVSLHREWKRAVSEYNSHVEALLTTLERNDDRARTLKYAHQAQKILETYKIRLQAQKIDVLATTMTTCYKALANKKQLIHQITMDPVTLDLTYRNAEGYAVPKESLSAGEKQLMVIALLWALAICSKKKLPVIIDTPLSRLDSTHRASLIQTYFPHASDQTIILSTDSEIDRHYYELMQPNVGDEFTLVYDDTRKCSTIVKGYFAGIDHDYQTN